MLVPTPVVSAVLGASLLLPASPAPVAPLASAPLTSARLAGTVPDPATWGNRRLAAQLTVSCVDLSQLSAAKRHAAAGIGAITLLGSDPPRRLRAALREVQESSRTRVRPLIASDEEGGLVQRLREVIYPLPSAATMGTWSTARVRSTAREYAQRMRRLGVRMDLAPVADLTVPGRYMARSGRTFSADPDRVARLARAWRLGMRDAGVVTVLKHWPGHGGAANTHNRPSRIAPLSTLEDRDLVPFEREFADGAPVVMVGHLLSAGLTRDGVPTSLSPRALRYLRRSAGPDAVIVTDSLTMAAASSALGISPARAAVRAIRAGADWAMACDGAPMRAVALIERALDRGTIPRARAVASVRRILALKARPELAPADSGG